MNAKRVTLYTLMGAFLLSGCATLAPERHAASNLMGQNISAAYAQFGTPFMRSQQFDTAKPGGDKVQDHKLYVWRKNGSSYNKTSLVGHEFGHDGGQPTITDTYSTERVQEACEVSLLADKNNIIDYFEVHGNCGLGGAGFGNTGALHSKGIN